MSLHVNAQLPEAKLQVVGANGIEEKTTAEIFGGKKTVLVAVPGAFTPTCTLNHLPGYLDNLDAILKTGVDQVVVIAVNDPFVMQAWAKASGGLGKVLFIADGSAVFTKQLDMVFDATAGGLGLRSKRYSAIIDNGVVKAVNVEPDPSKTTVSSAEDILKQLKA